MTKKEFALNQLREYVQDPSKCGFEDGACVNLTSSGKMCVASKNYLPEVRNEFPNMSYIGIAQRFNYDQSKFLIPESAGILSDREWTFLQAIHDSLAERNLISIERAISILNLFTLEELNALKTN